MGAAPRPHPGPPRGSPRPVRQRGEGATPTFQVLTRLLWPPRSHSRNRAPRLGFLPATGACPSGLALRTSGQRAGSGQMAPAATRPPPHSQRLGPRPPAAAKQPPGNATLNSGCRSHIWGWGAADRVQGNCGHRWARGFSVQSATGPSPPGPPGSDPQLSFPLPDPHPTLSPDPPRPGPPPGLLKPTLGAPALWPHTQHPPGLPPLPDGC